MLSISKVVVYRAVFDGTQVVHGELRIRVRVQKKSTGGGTYLLDATQALALEILGGIDGESALSNRVHHAKNPQELFLKNLLSHTERDEFLLYPRLDCLIIGTIVALRNEIHLRLASKGSHGIRWERSKTFSRYGSLLARDRHTGVK